MPYVRPGSSDFLSFFYLLQQVLQMKVTSECFDALARAGDSDKLQVSELQDYAIENEEAIKEIMVEIDCFEYSGANELPQMMMSAIIVSMPNNVLGWDHCA